MARMARQACLVVAATLLFLALHPSPADAFAFTPAQAPGGRRALKQLNNLKKAASITDVVNGVFGLTPNDPWVGLVESLVRISSKVADNVASMTYFDDSLYSQLLPLTKVAQAFMNTHTGSILNEHLISSGIIDLKKVASSSNAVALEDSLRMIANIRDRKLGEEVSHLIRRLYEDVMNNKVLTWGDVVSDAVNTAIAAGDALLKMRSSAPILKNAMTDSDVATITEISKTLKSVTSKTRISTAVNALYANIVGHYKLVKGQVALGELDSQKLSEDSKTLVNDMRAVLNYNNGGCTGKCEIVHALLYTIDDIFQSVGADGDWPYWKQTTGGAISSLVRDSNTNGGSYEVDQIYRNGPSGDALKHLSDLIHVVVVKYGYGASVGALTTQVVKPFYDAWQVLSKSRLGFSLAPALARAVDMTSASNADLGSVIKAEVLRAAAVGAAIMKSDAVTLHFEMTLQGIQAKDLQGSTKTKFIDAIASFTMTPPNTISLTTVTDVKGTQAGAVRVTIVASGLKSATAMTMVEMMNDAQPEDYNGQLLDVGLKGITVQSNAVFMEASHGSSTSSTSTSTSSKGKGSKSKSTSTSTTTTTSKGKGSKSKSG